MTTMCNVWLSLEMHAARAYASTARRVPTEAGTAILFQDGSAGYLTATLGWRQLLTRSRRDKMVIHLEVTLAHMERNWFVRLLSYYRRQEIKARIRILKEALEC